VQNALDDNHTRLKRPCQPANNVLTALAFAMYATQTNGRPSKCPNIIAPVLQGSKACTRRTLSGRNNVTLVI